jgi:hypothetical protein
MADIDHATLVGIDQASTGRLSIGVQIWL